MYQALYRACRPEVFSEILGQEHIVKILTHQLKEDSVSHAYLFCGTRGTGKTTTARILAKGLNCESPNADGTPCGKCKNCLSIKEGTFIDVIEIDAASNNGVDNIRELRESVNYPPQIGRKKVYIIDEVHMLSTGAFNALLKTLEEPPENVVFILATTEPDKLPKTILSRCMKLDFRRVPEDVLYNGMKKIAIDKGVSIEDSALKLIANMADGSVRDGLSILDQVLSSGEKNLSRDDVLEYIGAVSQDFYIKLTELMSLKKTEEALVLLDKALRNGKEVRQIEKDLLSHYRNLLISKFMKNPEDLINMSGENIKKLRDESMHISLDEINDAILKISKTINESRYSTQSRVLLELCIVEISSSGIEDTVIKREEVKEEIKKEVIEAPLVDYKKEEDKKITKEVLKRDNMNLDGIWENVIKSFDVEEGSINLVKTGTKLLRIDELTFLVGCNSNFTKIICEQKKNLLEDKMTKIISRPMRLIAEFKEEKSETEEDLSDLSKRLGVTVSKK